MLVIALLISAVLKGVEMMTNAKVTSTITQVKTYQASMYTFRDTYNALPGDMRMATDYIPGCTASAACLNGDGNFLIGTPTTDVNINEAGDTSLPGVETTMFWKHLVLGGFVSGTDTDASPTNPTWGSTHPSAKIGGGFHIGYIINANDGGSSGHMLRLQNVANEAPAAAGLNGFPLSPIRAAQIDRKMDDGSPESGIIRADFEGSGCDPEGEYANAHDHTCLMRFQLD